MPNPCFTKARKQTGHARTAVANHMQQMQDEYPGIQAPTPLQILNTGYGEDIADFCVSFLLFVFSACTRQCFKKAPTHRHGGGLAMLGCWSPVVPRWRVGGYCILRTTTATTTSIEGLPPHQLRQWSMSLCQWSWVVGRVPNTSARLGVWQCWGAGARWKYDWSYHCGFYLLILMPPF